MTKKAELPIMSQQLLKEHVTAATCYLFFHDLVCHPCIKIRLYIEKLIEMSTGLDTGIHSLVLNSDIQSYSHLYSEKACL